MDREQPHSVRINGRRTSVRLDGEIWQALLDICREEGETIHQLCSEVDAKRGQRSLVSALRVHAVQYFRRRAGS